MTDLNASEVAPTIPADDPAGTNDAGLSEFDRELQSFLDYNSMEKTPDGDPIELDTNKDNSDNGVTVKAPLTPEAAPANTTQVVAGNVTVTGNTTAPTDTVDPALVIEMMGFGKDKPAPTVAAPAATAPAPTEAPAPDAPFAPFRTDFQLPPALTQALFESEDADTRSKALVALLSSAMNAAVQSMDERFKTYHAPRTVEQLQQANAVAASQAGFVNDFFDEKSGFPDLKAHPTIVRRAIEVLAQSNPNVSWAEGRVQAAALARRVVAQITGQPEVKQVAPAPKAAPPKNAQHDAFLAGNARPAGVGDPVDKNSPASVFEDMSF